MKTMNVTCLGCDTDFTVGNSDRDEDGNVDLPTTQCQFCEGEFCADKCFRAHDCPGHDAEFVSCIWCQTECVLSKNKFGNETRPALIGGDPVCAKCAYVKPWEKKEPIKVTVQTTYFDKAI